MSAVTTDNSKVFSQLMSKSRNLAKISERRLQPLLVQAYYRAKEGDGTVPMCPIF